MYIKILNNSVHLLTANDQIPHICPSNLQQIKVKEFGLSEEIMTVRSSISG